MAPKRSFDDELAALESLRGVEPGLAAPQLAKALALRNNFLVAKAANLAVHHGLASLAPLLAEAFPRFLENPVKTDPQCWAKNALAKALAAFECQESALFLSGMRHHQLEPVWGGSSDTAGTLRGICALALVQCRELSSHRVLLHLTPLLADREPAVRLNAIRAVEQVGTDSAALLLRLHAELASDPRIRAALVPDDQPELLGACYSGVLSLEGESAIGWASQFLALEDDAAAEAAMAIAQTHTLEAFKALHAIYAKIRDPWFRTAVLQAIALTRQPEATDWLLDLIARDDLHASDAHAALCQSAPSEETRDRLVRLARSCP
ncbi:hypothetical protein FTO74_07260 [Granulicella sp. WH15]|uniref:hypothetical protein n=1 Tax=Granulicella sp. WH15 TaxID=2602070 RepID=UPI0013669C5A|nr:hypothetical protein [Granulicella sp. WH15]QHN03189.1 hypothetical protein FTO74_07260 [Granulicella sp. WH15]